MATTLTVNGVGFAYPQTGDESWGDNASAWAAAVTSGMLQKAGGSFALTAEVDFGATFGLKSTAYKSRAASPAGTGVVRMGNTEAIAWRNAANTADLSLVVSATDVLTFGGTAIPLSGAIVNADIAAGAAIAYSKLNLAASIVNADVSATAAIAYSKLALTSAIVNADVSASAAIAYAKLNLATSILNADISATAAIAYSKLAALATSRLLVSDVSGAVSASTVTSTEASYLSGVTSAIQTQLNTGATNLTNHTGSTTAHTAANIVNVAAGNLAATTVQGALDELQTDVDTRATTTSLNTHTANTSNPHSVTAAQVGNATAQWNANKLQGQTVSATVPTAGQVLKHNGTQWEPGIGGGSGTKNYITSGDAEGTVSGSLYADATAVPVDGTGGAATATHAQTTTSPLSGANSWLYTPGALGDGFAHTITIDREDLAQVLSIELSGEITTPASYTDGDMQFWIVAPSGAVIQPTGYKILKGIGTFKTQATFQAEATGTAYKVLLHQATAATAWTSLKYEIRCGPQVKSYGAVTTDWQAYTPTFSGFGAPTSVTGFWRRMGDSVQIQVNFITGTTTADEARVGLPNSLVIDGAKMSGTVISGQWNCSSFGATVYPTLLAEANASYVTFTIDLNAHSGFTKVAGSSIGNGITMTVQSALIPIKGWSSGQLLSSDGDTRVVAATITGLPTGTIGSVGAQATAVYPTVTKDTHGAYNPATGKFTAPVSGYYDVQASAAISFTSSAPYLYGFIYVDTTEVWSQYFYQATAADGVPRVSGTVYCNAGQTIEVRYATNAASPTYNNGNPTTNQLSIKRVSGPSQIAASEFLSARYTVAGAVPISTTQMINFATKTFDTHGCVTTGAAWKFVAPTAGYYSVDVCVDLDAGTIITLCKNGAVYSTIAAGDAGSFISSGSDTVYLLSGDYIDIRAGGATNTNAASTQTHVTITRRN